MSVFSFWEPFIIINDEEFIKPNNITYYDDVDYIKI